MPLVRAIARRYGGRGDELEDLVQAGALGLVRASSRFDPDRGIAFASFAAPAVEGEIRRHLRERAGHEPPHDSGSGDGAGDLPGAPEPDAESEARLLLEGGLQALDERERQIVFLRFNADMTERQIASKLGISQAHVSRLLKGALAKLRSELTSSDNGAQAGDSSGSAAVSPEQNGRKDQGGQDGRHGQGEEQTTSEQPIAAETAPASRRSTRSKSPNGYSGRILVRMPSELHEQLAHAAEREDLSLNRYVTQSLSTAIAPDPGDDRGSRPSARTLRVAIATNLAIVVIASVVAVALLVLALQRGI
jgi:RNA polymerase sigma-B factor